MWNVLSWYCSRIWNTHKTPECLPRCRAAPECSRALRLEHQGAAVLLRGPRWRHRRTLELDSSKVSVSPQTPSLHGALRDSLMHFDFKSVTRSDISITILIFQGAKGWHNNLPFLWKAHMPHKNILFSVKMCHRVCCVSRFNNLSSSTAESSNSFHIAFRI